MDITEIRFRRLEQAERLVGGLRQLAELADLNEKYLKQVRAGYQGKKTDIRVDLETTRPAALKRRSAALAAGWMS